MSTVSLQHFCNRIVEAGRITAADVRDLSAEILVDGIARRDEADLLLALDRAVADKAPGFTDLLTALVVDFAVWGERPTGTITRETAQWLAASIGGRSGPTLTGARIAVAIVREAQTSDETLIAFALSANGYARAPATKPRPIALAA